MVTPPGVPSETMPPGERLIRQMFSWKSDSPCGRIMSSTAAYVAAPPSFPARPPVRAGTFVVRLWSSRSPVVSLETAETDLWAGPDTSTQRKEDRPSGEWNGESASLFACVC